jgi:1,4-dihydroxy-2-naphthoate octaprenyltransferase
VGVVAREFPVATLTALLAIPFIAASARCASRYCEAPRHFLPAMRAMVAAYLVATGAFTAAVFAHRWLA